MDLRDRVAVVTGASLGIGRSVALELASAGATVIGVARSPGPLNDLVSELHQRSPSSWARPLDVADPAAVAAAFEDIVARHGRLDVLVNNAGIEERRPVQATTPEDVDRTMRINFSGTVHCCLAAVPVMVRQRAGRIVNVSSAAGRSPVPGTAAYCASKAAINAFSESISYELEPHGVRVQVLFPGYVPGTRLTDGAAAAGMARPPAAVHRTAEHVAKALVAGLGSDRFEINVARLETVAPVMRSLFPRLYRKGVVRTQPVDA